MMSRPFLKCYVDWNGCYRKLSRTIWRTMWIRSDDRGLCHDLIWGALWNWTDSEIKLSWPNLKCYLDLKIIYRKHSRPIWSTMWIRSGDRGWSHDLIWGHIWIWTDDTGCCLDQIYIAMWIGTDVRGNIHDQFEVLCGLEQVMEDDVVI
jgi:hypothetical protein